MNHKDELRMRLDRLPLSQVKMIAEELLIMLDDAHRQLAEMQNKERQDCHDECEEYGTNF